MKRKADEYYGPNYTAIRDPAFRVSDTDDGNRPIEHELARLSVAAGEGADGANGRMAVEGANGASDAAQGARDAEIAPVTVPSTEHVYAECVQSVMVPRPEVLANVPKALADRTAASAWLSGIDPDQRAIMLEECILLFVQQDKRVEALARIAVPAAYAWAKDQQPNLSGAPADVVMRCVKTCEQEDLFTMVHSSRALTAFETAIMMGDTEVRAPEARGFDPSPNPATKGPSFVKVALPPQTAFSGCPAGKVEGVHTIVQWAQEKKASCTLAQIPPDYQLEWSARFLEGDAAQWWQGLGKATCTSFEELVKGLTLRFVGRTAYDLLIRDLQSKRLQNFRSIEEYLSWLDRTLACLREFAGDRMLSLIHI